MRANPLATLASALLLAVIAATPAAAQNKPNILVIMGDDIGYWNLGYNNRGMMGPATPNIDRIAREGTIFTDSYAQQSCTAGRAAFITGQAPIRTGLTKVGVPGATVGIRPEDPTLAELLKPQGYANGQFGKNHLGDRNEFLPTVHGFDEFFGNLYHLNAEEEPEYEDYPQDPQFRARTGPRGVLRCKASERDDATSDPRFGRMGRQVCEDTGPLTRKRMETVDDEFLGAAKDFIARQHNEGKPWFVWFNSTRMHFYTHIRAEHRTRNGFYSDGMTEHDNHVGELLNQLDELGVTDNTIVLYTTDNGPHYNEWPDGGIAPFRGEKNTNWEGGFRVPTVIRWPGKIAAGKASNDIVAHVDWLPTLMAAAGDPDVAAKLHDGWKVGGRSYHVRIDGFNLLPRLTGQSETAPRRYFFYFSDDGDLMAIRHDDWKIVYLEQRAHYFDVWREPFVKLRAPKIFNLRRDPFERADTDSNNYNHWWSEHVYLIQPAAALAIEYLKTLREFPIRQKPASFNLDDLMRQLEAPPDGAR